MPTGKEIECKKCGKSFCFHIYWSKMVMEVRPKDEDKEWDEDKSRKHYVSDRWSDGKITGGICGNCGTELTEEEAVEVYNEIDFNAPDSALVGGL